jgi:hypothetical protein
MPVTAKFTGTTINSKQNYFFIIPGSCELNIHNVYNLQSDIKVLYDILTTEF